MGCVGLNQLNINADSSSGRTLYSTFTIRVQSSLPPLISLEMVTRHICKFGLLNQLSQVLGLISFDPAHLIEPKILSPFTSSVDFLRLFPPAHSRPLIFMEFSFRPSLRCKSNQFSHKNHQTPQNNA